MSINNHPASGQLVNAYFLGNGRQYEVRVDQVLVDLAEESELSSVAYAVIACTDDCRWLAYFSHYDVFDAGGIPAHDAKTYLFNNKAEMCNHVWSNVLDTEGATDCVALLALKYLGALRMRI